uniref:LOW QUALITY PROTEIN: 2-acylglycerol O-acyltransferase 2-B-like n=1 Tax=Odobenus rosmarus divergens TaxID=9708 RepID=UPI00063CBE5B|nr:PREDICTED: LOW QUALITY PROTEIN: 2-acylglycerol O-acyltransferase 2-B-like [Odobenus rosmarus divergens]
MLLLALLAPAFLASLPSRDTRRAGGRQSAWVRSWAIWRHFRDYSLARLVKTAEPDPSGNYLFGFHPHGVLVTGAFSNFCTEATGFSSLFPRLLPYLLMLPCWFYLPLFRDYIMCRGLVSSDKAAAAYLLSRPGGGQVAVLAVGGPLEALEAKAGELILWIRNQKGFVPLAREQGRARLCSPPGPPWCPAFSFGDNELFQQFPNPPGSRLRSAQEALPPLLSVALPLFQGSLGLLLPFRTPIHTVVGAPIPVQRSPRPSREQVDALHALSVERLAQRFEERKARYGLAAHPHLLLAWARRPRPPGARGGRATRGKLNVATELRCPPSSAQRPAQTD